MCAPRAEPCLARNGQLTMASSTVNRLAIALMGLVMLAGCNRTTVSPFSGATVEAAAPLPAATDATDPTDDESWYIGAITDKPYDIPLVDRSRMRPELMRQTVRAPEDHPSNTILVDIDKRFLYFYAPNGSVIRYAIGVGRRGFSWRGTAKVGSKAVWPAWKPTSTMRHIIAGLPARMEGGVDSPLGARALYLYQDGRDILFRIHGTNEPWSIGEQVSSGCVRMLNEDIYDLYGRVKVGAEVIVRNSKYQG